MLVYGLSHTLLSSCLTRVHIGVTFLHVARVWMCVSKWVLSICWTVRCGGRRRFGSSSSLSSWFSVVSLDGSPSNQGSGAPGRVLSGGSLPRLSSSESSSVSTRTTCVSSGS